MNTVTHIFEGRIAFLEGKLAIQIKILSLCIVFDPIIVTFLGINSEVTSMVMTVTIAAKLFLILLFRQQEIGSNLSVQIYYRM